MNDLKPALEALKTYDRGSGRAALLPLDDAVKVSLADKSARTTLEQQLVIALNAGGPAVAREFLCSKLALIGTDLCVPALAALLSDPQLATAARNALEAIPSHRATTALLDHLPKLGGPQKIGVIHSLGARRDGSGVRSLVALLRESDPDTVAAAAAALGDIASTKAAKALCAFLPQAPQALQPKVADAILTCAERLLAAGHKSNARTLYQALLVLPQPAHLRDAAARGLGRFDNAHPDLRAPRS